MIFKRAPRYNLKSLVNNAKLGYYNPGIEAMYVYSETSSSAGRITSYDMNGNKLQFDLITSDVVSCAATDPNGNIFFVMANPITSGANIHKYDPYGNLVASVIGDGTSPGDTYIKYSNGYIYGGVNGCLVKYDLNLNQIWSVSGMTDGPYYIYVDASDNVYTGNQQTLYKINSSGSTTFTVGVGIGAINSIVVKSDGSIIVAGNPGTSPSYRNWQIYSSTGTLLSSGTLGSSTTYIVDMISDGTYVYVASGSISCNLTQGNKLKVCNLSMSYIIEAPTYLSSNCIRANTLFFYNNKIYSFGNIDLNPLSVSTPGVIIYSYPDLTSSVSTFSLPYAKSRIIY